MPFHELLRDTFAYMPPLHIVGHLSEEDARRPVAGVPHTIADLVAHIVFWQSWFLDRLRGVATPMAASAAEGWPAVPPGGWSELVHRFRAGLDEAVRFGEDGHALDRRVDPPIEFPPLAEYTRRDVLSHLAAHNAHHLGQVVTLRQILGLWPPPEGSWTW